MDCVVAFPSRAALFYEVFYLQTYRGLRGTHRLHACHDLLTGRLEAASRGCCETHSEDCESVSKAQTPREDCCTFGNVCSREVRVAEGRRTYRCSCLHR